MVRFDTMTIAIPESTINRVNRHSFVENQQTDLQTGAVFITQQAKNEHLPIGVSRIQYKEGRDYLVTISAKTLGQDYLEGINLNNWGRAISGISPVLDVDLNRLWDENPKINRCDNTDNILLSDIGYSKNEVCRSLYSARRNERFIPKWYESKNKLGVEFFGTQEEKNRLIVYDKKLDLLKHQNKAFRESIPNLLMMYTQADKTLRFETNHTSFRSMRNRFDVDQNNLQEMLNSKSQVNYNFLSKVMNKEFTQVSLWDELKNYEGKGIDFVMMKGYENIITELGCDKIAVKKFFKELLGERSFKYYWSQVKTMPTIQEMLTRLKIQSEKEMGKLSHNSRPLSIVNRVMECLKEAV
jgi:hypothetical protein